MRCKAHLAQKRETQCSSPARKDHETCWNHRYEDRKPGPDLSEIGVEGSMIRRLIDLFTKFGHELVDVQDVDHPSRTVLVFDPGAPYLTEITWVDKERS